MNLHELVGVLAKWKWIIVALTVAGAVAAIAVSLLLPERFTASMTIEINQQPTQIVQMANVQPIEVNDGQFMQTQLDLLASRALAQRVAAATNFQSRAQIAGASPAARQRAAVNTLQKGFSVTPGKNSRVVRLSFEGRDPALAAQVVNSYADAFITANLDRRYEASAVARRVLQDRITKLKATLETSERRLFDYAKSQNILILGNSDGEGGSGTGNSLDASSLMALNGSLATAQEARIAAEQRYRQGQAGTASEIQNNSTVLALEGQRAQVQTEYNEKLNLFKPDYPSMVQLKSRIDALTASIQNSRNDVRQSLASDYRAAAARESALRARVNQLSGDVMSLRGRGIQYTILQREVDTNRSIYNALLQRFKEVGVTAGTDNNLIGVVDRAQVPQGPSSPNVPLNIALGLIGGLVAGLGLAFAVEMIDDTIKGPEDITAKLGLSVLGVIPKAPKGAKIFSELAQPRSSISEAYQSLRTALQFSTGQGIPKVLLCTSTRPAEGKSTTALAVARAIAKAGSSVLLIDSDLRRPSFRIATSDEEGLSVMLTGSDDLEANIHQTGLENFALMLSGPLPPNPSELLATHRIRDIIAQARGQFDLIVVDAPPVLGLADAPLLASVCDGTILLIEAGATRRAAIRSSIERLRMANANIVGAVLSKFDPQASYAYGYGYGYGYGYSYDYEEKENNELRKIEVDA